MEPANAALTYRVVFREDRQDLVEKRIEAYLDSLAEEGLIESDWSVR